MVQKTHLFMTQELHTQNNVNRHNFPSYFSSKIIILLETFGKNMRNSVQTESIRGSVSEQTSNHHFSNYLVKNATLKYCVASKDLFNRYRFTFGQRQNKRKQRQMIGGQVDLTLQSKYQLQKQLNMKPKNQLQTQIYEFQSNQESQISKTNKKNIVIRQDPISEVYKPIKIINRYKCKQLLVLQNNNKNQKVLMKANKNMIKRGNHLVNGQQQVQNLSLLSHPCVIQLKQVFFNFDKYLLIFEHFQGICLLEYLQKYTITQRIARVIIKQILQTLKYLHKLQIIHRDIRAQHIFVSFDKDQEYMKIKIVDFSYAISKQKIKHHRLPASGSYYRNAPEVLQGIINSKTDIWSVGVLALVLFLRFSPEQIFNGDYIQAIMTKNQTFQKNSKNIPENALDFINFLMTVKHRRRPSASEALNHSWIKNIYSFGSQNRPKFAR